MSREKLNFAVNDDGTVNVHIKDNSGAMSTRIISFSDLVNSFQSDDLNLELPLFPRGLRKYKAHGQRTLVGIEYPPSIVQKVHWREDGQTYENIPTPGSVWLTLLSNNTDGTFRIIKNNLYAVDAFGLIDENTTLYNWPFPNHSLSYSSGVCWGNDKNFERIKNNATLSSLSSLYSMYFSAKFNNDLSYYIDMPSGNDDKTLFEFLQNKPAYESAWLKKLENATNFKQAVQKLIGD